QRQPAEIRIEPVGICVDDALAVEPEPNRGPLAAARRVTEGFDHRSRVRAPPCRGSSDLVNLENQVGFLRAVGNAFDPTQIPFHLLLVQLCGRRTRTGSSTWLHSSSAWLRHDPDVRLGLLPVAEDLLRVVV